jgi:circadian clock protein KaiC
MSNEGVKDLVSTGVAGLDNVLLGGFLRGGFYLLQGDPGSGKTTIALQFVHSRLRAGERCLYISLTESRADLQNACRSHGWSLEGLEVRELTRSAATLEADSQVSVFHPADTELSDITKTLMDEMRRVQPQHVVFDGLSEVRLLAGDPLRYRRTLLSIKEMFAKRSVTTLLLDDRSAGFTDVQPESLVGGNIVFRYYEAAGEMNQAISVFKKRTGPHERTIRRLTIDEGGFAVSEPLRHFRGVMTGVPQYELPGTGQSEPTGAGQSLRTDR